MSIKILFEKDNFLLKEDVNERSITHKLAEYIQQQFPNWNVDCEYNKIGVIIKKLHGIRECSNNRSTDKVYPDIIIHKRNQTENLVVIAVKKGVNGQECDKQKLIMFTSEEDYKYFLGLFIIFNKLDEPKLTWFKEGKELSH